MGGVLERDYEPFGFAVLGSLRSGSDASLGEAGERSFVRGNECALFGCVEDFVGESIRKRRGFFVEFFQIRLIRFGKIRAVCIPSDDAVILGLIGGDERVGFRRVDELPTRAREFVSILRGETMPVIA